jgi:hypothetical protein
MGQLTDPAPVGTPSLRERRLVWLAIAAAVLIAIAFPAAAYWKAHRFDRTRWLAGCDSDARDCARAEMLSDLLGSRLRLGMRRQQVRALLGNPDSSSQCDRVNRRDVYGLGLVGWSAIDPSVLEFQYDQAGRLVSMRVYET